MGRESHDQQRVRYARQTALAAWGEAGQRRLSRQRALVIGLGGLGSPVATYLAAAGIGGLTLNDFDRVDLSNLHRQPLHGTADVGAAKTESARATLAALNPNVELTVIDGRLFDDDLRQLVADHDVVADCSDNFATRFAVNAACAAARVPLVSAAAIRFEGQLAVFTFADAQQPCYACLYNENDDVAEDCHGQGVSGPLVGVMGSMAAGEALKILLDIARGECALHCYNALDGEWRQLGIRKRPDCVVCAAQNA